MQSQEQKLDNLHYHFREGCKIIVQLKIKVKTPDGDEHDITDVEMEGSGVDIDRPIDDAIAHLGSASRNWIPSKINDEFDFMLERVEA